jgi:hypothetical protein
MNRNELRDLLIANFKPVSGVNFSDVESATRNAIIDFFQLDNLSPRELKTRRLEVMALIEEAIDEVLPEKLQDRVGDFAEIKQYARDAEVVFNLKNKGKRRAYLSIKKGARGGLYHAARWDDVNYTLQTWTETVGVFLTLEEFLLGKYSLSQLFQNILDGFVERLYVEVIEAMQAAESTVPTANVSSGSGIDYDELDGIIRVVSTYGAPIIMGFHKVVSKINNAQNWSTTYPNIPTEDLTQIRGQGFVNIYKGTPVVLLPNYIVDENTNADWLLDESRLFILPTGEKPVKVALKGDMYIQPVDHPTGSQEWAAHKMLGVGIILNNNLGIYQDLSETEA